MSALVPIMKKFSPELFIEIKVQKRGFRKDGGGEVLLKSGIVKFLKSVDLTDKGLIKRVRGIACGTKVSPHILVKMVSACREVLNDYIPDVWVHTDGAKGACSGYGINVVAETTSGMFICSDEVYEDGRGSHENTPEELGKGGFLTRRQTRGAAAAGRGALLGRRRHDLPVDYSDDDGAFGEEDFTGEAGASVQLHDREPAPAEGVFRRHFPDRAGKAGGGKG